MSKNKRSKKYQQHLLVLSGFLVMNSAAAIEVTKDFYLPTAVDFDTNIRMSSKDEKEILRFTLNPRVKLVASDELNTYSFDTSLFMAKSSDENVSENRNDPTSDLGWARSFERGDFSVLAHYNKASIRTSELTSSGAVFSDESSINKSLNANLNYLLNDRYTIGTGIGYQKQNYTGAGLSNYNTKNLSFKLTHLYSEKVTPFYQYSMSDFKDEDRGRKSISKNFSAGINYYVNPKLNLMVSAGVNHVNSVGNSWIGSSTAQYGIDDNSAMTAALSRSVSASGLGGFQKSDSFSLGYTRDLTQKDRLGVNYVWDINRSINDSRFMQLSGWYARDLSADWSLRLTAQQRNLKSTNQSADGSQIGLSIVYNQLNF